MFLERSSPNRLNLSVTRLSVEQIAEAAKEDIDETPNFQ
jgi:hypothetical protein